MIRRTVTVQGTEFQIRLPENYRELKRLSTDTYSAIRLLQIAIHQRQLQHIAALMKTPRSTERIQELMDEYRYNANSVGGSVEK